MIRPKQPRIRLSQKKYTQLKKHVYNRDKYCLICGRTDNATPAHVIRKSQGGNDSPNNLIRLCQDCHTSFDNYEIELPEHVKRMLEQEPLYL